MAAVLGEDLRCMIGAEMIRIGGMGVVGGANRFPLGLEGAPRDSADRVCAICPRRFVEAPVAPWVFCLSVCLPARPPWNSKVLPGFGRPRVRHLP